MMASDARALSAGSKKGMAAFCELKSWEAYREIYIVKRLLLSVNSKVSGKQIRRGSAVVCDGAFRRSEKSASGQTVSHQQLEAYVSLGFSFMPNDSQVTPQGKGDVQ